LVLPGSDPFHLHATRGVPAASPGNARVANNALAGLVELHQVGGFAKGVK
jgi:hypothetical protein